MTTDNRPENVLATEAYSRERLTPRPSDVHYLHLYDLRLALASVETDAPLRVLDYGCGSSPYRSLFPRSDYRRADFLEVGVLDYRLATDSRVPESDGVFDFILSTQVLEHVPEPEIYLSECFRLLKPGGKIFLTTHGTYEDHGCPYDFRRWTADGLRADFVRAGFSPPQIYKLTTGPRALVFLLSNEIWNFWASRRTIAGLALWLFRSFFYRFRPAIHHFCDEYFQSRQRVPDTQPHHLLYIALSAYAERPA